MYRVPQMECQEKNCIFRKRSSSLESHTSHSRAVDSQSMRVMEERERGAGEDVVPCVRDHAGAEGSARDGESAEERAKCGDGDHAGDAFVTVADAKEQRRDDHADPEAMSGRRELAQEVSAEDGLFAEAG